MFWSTLANFFTVLAPMEDVTDTVFRQIIAGVGRPDVFFTEFTNVDAVVYAIRNSQNSVLELPVPAAANLQDAVSLRADFAGIPALQRLVFSKTERPLVAQIWGVDPEKFKIAAEYVAKLGFDGIDINLGCPERKVTKMGACGGMIGQNAQVAEIVAAVKEGAGGLPVSVKTRIGNKKIITEDWIGFLLTLDLAALTVHGRTVAEQSLVPAHWDEIGKAVKLRDQVCGSDSQSRMLELPVPAEVSAGRGFAARARFVSPAPLKTLIIGNGDVVSLEDARNKAQEFGVDGVMIGRGVFQNPWVFTDKVGSQKDRLDLLKKHLDLWEKTWGDKKNFAVMKKFVKMYVRDFDGASELRVRLMECKTAQEMTDVLH